MERSIILNFLKISFFQKLLFGVIISMGLLCASPANAADIFDLFLIKSIKDINEPLIERVEQVDFPNNILIVSKIKEILRNSSGEELAGVLKVVEKLSAYKIKTLVDSEILKRASPSIISEFDYFERVVFGATPVEDASCNETGGKCYLNGLNPERDSLDLPDLKLSRATTIVSPDSPSPEWPKAQRGKKYVLSRTFDDRLEPLWDHSPAKTPFIKFRHKLWNREYQESEFYPAYTNGKVFIQNTYRMECLDAFSGKVKWTFSPGAHNGYDEKLIVRSNIYDKQPLYYMAVENDDVYAELVNQLVKVDASLDKPRVRWQVSLGAYSLASKPHIVGDKIFVALINSRGELWGVMLDKENGMVLWSTYIALVTQVCPSSDLVAHDDSTLYFVTNRGVSVAFDLAHGSTKWLLEYPTTKYPITDIWKKEGDFWRFTEVPYATAWTGVDDDVVVMKPRDSDVVYFRDKDSGKELAHFYLDDMTFLMSDGMTAFFLKNGIVSAVNIITGKQIKVGEASTENLRGVLYDPVKRECVVKLGQSLFLLQSHKGAARLSQLKSKLSDDGWLRGFKEEGVYFDCSKSSVTRYGVKVSGVANNEDVREPKEIARSPVVAGASERKHTAPIAFMKDRLQDDFVVCEGEKVRSLAVLYDSPDFPFFFTVKNDVLICAAKSDAQVIWTKRLIGSYVNLNVGSSRINGILRAALYGEILVVFDGVNLFGADAASGEIRWSVSIHTENISESFLYQTLGTSRHKPYLFDALFDLDSIVYFREGALHFIEPRTGRALGVVDTKHRYITGLKREGRYLMCGYLLEAKVALYDCQNMALIKELDLKNVIPDGERHAMDAAGLNDSVKNFESAEFSMAFQYPYCYLQVASGLWSFNFMTEEVVHEAGEFATQKNWSVGIIGREIISFNPSWKVVIWDAGLRTVKKEVPFSSKSYEDSVNDAWQHIEAASQLWSLREATFIHSVDSTLICPVKEPDGIYVVGIDARKGVQRWKVFATNFYPKIWHMSNSVVIGDVICFTLSVKDQGKDLAGDDGYVDTIFMAIDAKNGVVLKQIRFPLGISWGKYTHYLSSVGNNVLVNENDERIRVFRIKP